MTVIIVMGLFGCESEEAHQHHLYNLEGCRAEARGADAGDLAAGTVGFAALPM
jgi:hypothetical protein